MSVGNEAQQLLIQNRLLSEEIQRRVNQLAAINAVATAVSQTLDLDATLETALEAVLSIITLEAAAISLIDTKTNELVLRAQYGLTLDFVTPTPMRIPLGQGLSGLAVAENRVVVSGNVAEQDTLAVPSFSEEQIKAQVLAPMHARGKVIGILSVMSHEEHAFTEDEVSVLTAIADQVGIALDNARLFEQTMRQKRRLSTVIHSAADAIIATDVNGNINLFNQAARFIFDIQPEQVIGMPLREAPIDPALAEHLHHAMQKQDEAAAMFDVTMIDGQTFTAIVSPLRSESQVDQGKIGQGWVVVMRDITHLKEAEQTRLHFIQSAAHDLRNPISVTLSALVMLEEMIEGADEQTLEILSLASDAIQRTDLILDDMLNLERIQSGLAVEMTDIELPGLLKHTLHSMQTTFNDQHQTTELDCPADLPPIYGSSQWLERAVGNYLSNASKYTQQGSHIILRAVVHDDNMLIEVEDNGSGIDLASQSRLFERFYRVPSNIADVKGTGLGLAIVKSVAEAHEGRVYVHSKPGKGSIFGISLPLKK